MHPILARGNRLALYLALWLVVGLLLAALLAARQGLSLGAAIAIALPIAVAYAFVCLSAWYVSRGMPLALTGGVRVAATALTAAVLSSAALVALARGWMRFISLRAGLRDAGGPLGGFDSLLFGFGLLLYLLAISVSYVLAAFEASQAAERRGLQVQVLAREAELRSLRAQIDPHFLFNALHSISALTTADPPAARRMCLLLGDFLRDSLAYGGEDQIPLARELALVERFLAIERVRFGDRLAVEIGAGDAGGCRVPPLLLQPLVENAVKHGIAHLVGGGTIRVAAARQGGVVRLLVENPCDPDRPRRAGGGVGLANVRGRLRTLYGSDAHLSAAESDGAWRVEVVLPAVEHA